MNINASSFTYDFLLRNYYSPNRSAAKAITRGNVKDGELITADSSALKKISKAMRDLEYTSDKGVDIYNNIKAFVDAYNNLDDSSSTSISYDISQPKKLLKNLVKEHADDLEKIGITISASGKLSINETTLLESSPEKIGKIFSADSDFTNKVKFYAGKIYKASNFINLSTPAEITSKKADKEEDKKEEDGIEEIINKSFIDMIV